MCHAHVQVLDDGRLTDVYKDVQLALRMLSLSRPQMPVMGRRLASVGFELLVEGREPTCSCELGNFSPEFMNRFDGIIEFKPSARTTFSKSSNPMLWCWTTASSNNIHLDVTDWAPRKSYFTQLWSKMGARPLRQKFIQDHIEDAITDFYLKIQVKRPQGSHDKQMAIFKSNSPKLRKMVRDCLK